ncbi:hypothetical protein CAPTEDRAFT_154004 [Capitella teleta]|uniref:Zinc finger protein 865 n=1 Tax=Capitella teleta TaxID=283909 RepID=R7U8N5_CAPTE|nr:hypothetical protein CAPTEDRAFT_154004 [Capitella teleta]|eukprot:ELT99475.1 hypothetical protein CAPTEDRAFT_154004 [Capitella teleta]
MSRKMNACQRCGASFKWRSALSRHKKTWQISLRCEVPGCTRVFYCKELFDKHMRMHANGQYRYRCDQCGQFFSSSYNLKGHVISKHAKDQAFKCVGCAKEYSYKQSKRHRKKTNPINLVCSVCGKQCRKPYELRLHMRGHENDRPFECGVCRKRFVSKCYLNKHTRDVHDASHLKCKECCIGFESKEQLREHCENHSHHIQWPYQCSHCDKSFPKRSVLVAHQRQHEGKRHFKCTHCTAAFFSKSALDQHSWLHTERPFACEQCSSRFLTKHLLNMHMMDHTGQRPYLCDTCGQRFKTKAQLQHHSEVHADGLPFVCEVCGKNFKWKNNLVKHVRKHAAATRGEEELPFVCSICRKSYANKQSLNYHAMTHTGERPFACSHCSKSFRGAGHLRKHVKHMHRNDPAQSVSNATASEPEIQAPEIQSPEIQAPVLHVMPAAYSAGGEGPRRPSELTGCCTVDASLLGLAPLLTLDVASNMPSDQNHILYPFNTISPHNL